MRKPTQMEAFDTLYALAAGNGREEALFGDSIHLARPAFERTLIGSEYPTVYLEFPLLGEPGFDFLSVFSQIEIGARFAPGAGFGRQDMFDWLAEVCEKHDSVSCGLELDTSTGETERAGVYLQQRKNTELVAPFLERIGESARIQSYLDALSRMPEGWPPSYVGLFPGRAGTPIRIGGYMSGDARTRCAKDPTHLAKCFRRIGFEAFDDDMLDRCSEFMRLAPSVDFQFDIMGDGSLGDTFGLSLSFNETKPRQAHECMESGYGAELMGVLQGWGLADDRWRLIADAAFGRHVPYKREDGSNSRLALCVLFNYAKVKFCSCKARPAKFYLALIARDLDDAVKAHNG